MGVCGEHEVNKRGLFGPCAALVYVCMYIAEESVGDK